MKQNTDFSFSLYAEPFQYIHVVKSPDKNIKHSTDNEKKLII